MSEQEAEVGLSLSFRSALAQNVRATLPPEHRGWVDDIVQTTVEVTWRRRSSVDNPEAYARTVAVNAARRRARTEGRVRPGLSHDDLPHEDTSFRRTEIGLDLNRAIDTLPPKMRQVMRLRLDELSYREIAAELGIAVGTVGTHLHNARSRLRVLLRDGHGDAGRQDGCATRQPAGGRRSDEERPRRGGRRSGAPPRTDGRQPRGR